MPILRVLFSRLLSDIVVSVGEPRKALSYQSYWVVTTIPLTIRPFALRSGRGPNASADDQEIGRPSKSNVQVASESGCRFALQKQLYSFHRIKIQHK